MRRISRIGKFDKVSVATEGGDCIIQLPANPSRCHWADMQAIVSGLQQAIEVCQKFEADERTRKGLN